MTGDEEVLRLMRLIDQMTSSYSKLRDDNSLWATLLVAFELTGGLALVGIAFAPALVERAMSLPPDDASNIVAAAGALLFLASLLNLAFDPRGKAAGYGLAADRFAELKLQHRGLIAKATTQDDRDRLRSDYEFACRTSPKIPERDFLRLKQYHRRKLLISRMIDRAPMTPLLLLKMKAMAGRADVTHEE